MSELVPGSLRGFRVWRVVDDKLVGAALQVWNGPAFEAACVKFEIIKGKGRWGADARHQAPVRGCSCGIYAYYRARPLFANAGELGVVEATGRVIMHTEGFRAERARIVAITRTTPPHRAWPLDAFPGVEIFRSRAGLLAAYPPQDVTGLLDEARERVAQERLTLRRLGGDL